ncbi:50S ribosomal protein L4 [Candidatus Kaiserbacteria bacterium CG10_big_fil_rev_8_21_14_0_10_45_20]|uniref:Large ribosomal subunit protein uL4 n=1 Tax=Candidatus Kaiserbacteria bacterium CG10_big_fil_rev_8_21_14_0_10_45_20 TaxID=1974607 RepID=A0A2H0UFG5_9BACT|nr:MAG: 50S ribosomal protein L4 [Candidatus Kaiserbacteria bacterium CG10_big_fil_rev_8_21_14_0_10_45_20]
MATEKKTTVKKKAPSQKVAPKTPKATRTLSAKVYSVAGKEVSTITLPENIFGLPKNDALVHQVLVSTEANARTNVAHTKGRGEVRGGGKKPWKQKGTGRARHGSIRSPIWRGGGTTFGPTNERDFSQKINKKMRVKALTTVLSGKFSDEEVVFVDSLSFSEPKTKDAKALLGALAKATGVEALATRRKNAALVVIPSADENAKKSFKNMGNVEVIVSRNLNISSLLTYRYIVIVNPEVSFESLPVNVK